MPCGREDAGAHPPGSAATSPDTLGGALTGSLLFHLNLAYSSIEERERAEVVRRCYEPILALAEENDWLPLAVEAPAWTLERIAELDLDWIPRLRVSSSARTTFGELPLVLMPITRSSGLASASS